MLIEPFQAFYPQFQRITSPDAFCADAKNAYPEYQRQDLVSKAERPAVYVYQIEEHHRLHTGLIALNAVQEILDGKIKKHEKTLREREQHQMELFLRWGAVLKPVLLTYPAVPAIRDRLLAVTRTKKPLFETHFKKEGQFHRIWMLAESEDIESLQALFKRHVPVTYIADGHHRTSTLALLYENHRHEYPELDFDRLFCAYFATDQLDILDFNRVVAGLNGLSPEIFLERLSEVFQIEAIENPRKPRHKFELKMLLGAEWYRLHWKPDVLARGPQAYGQAVLLDVSLLNELVLHRLLGIGDVRTDVRIQYVEGSKGLKGIRKAVQAGPDRVGFVLHPVLFDDMMQVADAGESLPPKSTFFSPRMKTGLLVKGLLK